MKSRKIFLIIALVGAMIIGALYALNALFFDKQNLRGEEGYSMVSPFSIPPTQEEKAKWFSENFEKYVDAVQASRTVSFEFRLPKYTAGRDLLGIYGEKGKEAKDRIIEIDYGDFIIRIEPAENKPDLKGFVEQTKKDKASGILLADKTPELLTVDRFEGTAIEPGYNLVNGNKIPRVGYVDWYDEKNKVHYVIGSYKLSLDEMMSIAKSVY